MHSILILFPTSFLFICTVRNHVVHPYSNMNTGTSLKKSCYTLSDKSDFHLIDNLSISVSTFIWHVLTLLSIDEMLLPRYANWSANFRGLPLKVKMIPFYLHSYRGQCLSLFDLGHAVGILLGIVYL